MKKWNKYCGDKDLWGKYSFGTVFYKSKPRGKKQEILSIYRSNGLITVNLKDGSFPLCSKIIEDRVKITNGFKCDEILLTK